ncbi:SDR family NAD(P)-dependent oxidoreductase [uncultured Paludibaculum sp.]|uniref:SDR family NAD(P)-dependent oxidoreductase n=1 Tax=uncultured Paludibaculum sp. TaxID=1765020 RepID=UPI002AAB0F8C|nr:SDR family NAD(P)-dependent oxidoreductase [uncultured Paludibaculum sp.]
MTKVWLITGSANGLGRDVAETALAAGHRVVATARRPEELQDLVQRYGDNVRAVRHDVRNSEQADAAVASAIEVFGRLDVLVNNAGYGKFAPFEQFSAEEFKDIVDTCFYGVVHTTRAALPVMRKQRSGVILQVSSVGGRITRPGNAPYLAAKWAVSGLAEALAQETAAFGVQVCALEPGGIRTNWGRRANSDIPRLLPEYEESVGGVLRMLDRIWGQENSDPRLIAELIVKLADRKDLPPHLVLGSDALTFLKQADDERAELLEKWRDTSLSVDFQSAASAGD